MVVFFCVVDIGYFWFGQVVVLVDVGEMGIGFIGVDYEVGQGCDVVVGDDVYWLGWVEWFEEIGFVVQVCGDFCFVGYVVVLQVGYFGQFDFVDVVVVVYQGQYEVGFVYDCD